MLIEVIMSFWDIFKKKNKKDEIITEIEVKKSNDIKIREDNFEEESINERQQEIQFEKSRELIKKATSFKKDDINKAISIIEEAIKVCPEKVEDHYFKLANYKYFAGEKVEAYKVLTNLLDSLDFDDISMYNMSSSTIYQKICILNYKDKNYEEYITNYLKWHYHLTIAFACQGRESEFMNSINIKDFFIYLAPTKINNSLKKLNLFITKILKLFCISII